MGRGGGGSRLPNVAAEDKDKDKAARCTSKESKHLLEGWKRGSCFRTRGGDHILRRKVLVKRRAVDVWVGTDYDD